MNPNTAINKLTDHNRRYKMASPYMLQALNGLYPFKLSRLATDLFQRILITKMYSYEGQSKQQYEDIRIFNNVEISVDLMLRIVYDGKYEDGGLYEKGKPIENDRSEMRRMLKKIDDNNIFHMWKYHQQYEFFIERHLPTWKPLNEDAVIPPKTIKKIANIAQVAVDQMMLFEHRSSGKDVVRADIEGSFGAFVNKLISKMSPSVSSRLTRWDTCNSFHKYIENLKIEASKLDDFDGLIVADSFYKRIPYSTRNTLEKEFSKEKNEMRNNKENNKEKTEMEKEKTELENELIPKDANICKNKGKKTKEKKKKKSKVNESEPWGWHNFTEDEDINPFLNAPTFAKYYIKFIEVHSEKDPKFEKVGAYTSHAGVILDRMGELGKKGNIDFLNAWLRYFLATGLKGRKIGNIEHTHIKKLYGTLEKFNGLYYVPQ